MTLLLRAGAAAGCKELLGLVREPIQQPATAWLQAPLQRMACF